MTDAVVIRDADPSETDGIIALTLSANAPYAAVIGEAWWNGYQEVVVAALTQDSRATKIVAERQGILVGSVLLVPGEARDSGVPEVRLLAVEPTVRGQGIGRRLMWECLHRVRALGAPMLHLHTMAAMETAIRLYERMGFVRVPAQDFNPVEGVIVLGYQHDLMDHAVS